MTKYQSVLKRIFDIVASASGIVVLSPVVVLLFLLLKVTSRNSPIFVQERIGRYGVPFKCFKFRTMLPDSYTINSVTTANDSRVTSTGKFLRRLKIDEIPQLWNVLIGKMSFVGPRPDVPGYADKIAGDNRKILELRPGITGPATLFFRYEEELLALSDDPVGFNNKYIWPVKIILNRQYAEQWSFFKDIGFIVITIFPVLNRVLHLVLTTSPRTIETFYTTVKQIRHTYSSFSL